MSAEPETDALREQASQSIESCCGRLPDCPTGDVTVACMKDHSNIEYQVLTMLIGDFQVRLLPKYRGNRRPRNKPKTMSAHDNGPPTTSADDSGRRCLAAARPALLSKLDSVDSMREDEDDDDEEDEGVTVPPGECQRNSDTFVDNRTSPYPFLRQSINDSRFDEPSRDVPDNRQPAAIVSSKDGERPPIEQRVRHKKTSNADGREDADTLDDRIQLQSTMPIKTRHTAQDDGDDCSTIKNGRPIDGVRRPPSSRQVKSEFDIDDIELLRIGTRGRTPAADSHTSVNDDDAGDERTVKVRSTAIAAHKQFPIRADIHVAPPTTAGGHYDRPPAYQACVYSEPEVDDDDRCRDEPLLLMNIGSKMATSAESDRPRGRKLTIDVGRRRRLTMALGRRLGIANLKNVYAAGHHHCDPYECGRKMLGFLASTIGLTCLLIGYTALGGWLFVRLEGQNGRRVQSNMRMTRDLFVERLWNMTERFNVLHPDNWTSQAGHILDDYAVRIHAATKWRGWDPNRGNDDANDRTDDNDGNGQWSYAEALLFSITVITTIGYGHITPKTPLGRLATIIYAVIGIPLTLLAITQLGGIMATLFRFIYKNLNEICRHVICRRLRQCRCSSCCRNWCRRSAALRRKKRMKKRDVAEAAVAVAEPACVEKQQTGNANNDESNRLVVPVEGVGQEQVKQMPTADAETREPEVSVSTWHTVDDVTTERRDSVTDFCVATAGDKSRLHNDEVTVTCDSTNADVICPIAIVRSSDEEDPENASVSSPQLRRMRWTARLRSRILDAFADVDEVRVPAWVCMLLVVGYIVLGALVFSVWERVGGMPDVIEDDSDNWNFLVGCYFCFITLSTIGFGDYVPGTRHVTWDGAQEKLILCALYLLVGLALQAMCFQLIQEDVRRAVRALGIRLGLISQDDERG